MISDHDDAFYLEEHGYACDLAEQSWALKAKLWSQCSDWKS